MSDQDETLLGRIAVRNDLITMDELAHATREQARRGGGIKLGQVLVELGYLEATSLDFLLEVQKKQTGRERPTPPPAAATAPLPAAAFVVDPTGSLPRTTGELPIALTTADFVVPVADVDELDRELAITAANATASDLKGQQQHTVSAPRPVAAAETSSEELPDPPRASHPAPPEPPKTPRITAPTPPADSYNRGQLEGILQHAVQLRASDIHFHSGAPITVRVNGDLQPINDSILTKEEAEPLLLAALGPEQQSIFVERHQLDFSYTIPGVGRYRANLYRQQRGIDCVFRLVPPKPPSLEELGLPSILAKFTTYPQGMVLLTGPAGCGKSATMAALINIINEERREHILTIEDPIEVLHTSKRSLVNQRQVGNHTRSFARALKGALREDPDVIAIGELRDLETISLALSAAETGHLVLGTLHTNDAIRTVNRLIGVFPPEQQSQIRTMVSESLRGIVSQRLVRTADGNGRVPAMEILVFTRAVGNLVREGKTFQLKDVLQTGSAHGMCTLDNSLDALVKAKKITSKEAAQHAVNPQRFGE